MRAPWVPRGTLRSLSEATISGYGNVNMRAILIPYKGVEALKGEAFMSAHLTPTKKNEMNDKSINIIILCLKDKVLREVARDARAVSM